MVSLFASVNDQESLFHFLQDCEDGIDELNCESTTSTTETVRWRETETENTMMNKYHNIIQVPKSNPLLGFSEDVYTIDQDSDFTLTCEVAESFEENISWHKKYNESLASNVEKYGNVLRIFRAQPENQGVYECRTVCDGLISTASTIIIVKCKEKFTFCSVIRSIKSYLYSTRSTND